MLLLLFKNGQDSKCSKFYLLQRAPQHLVGVLIKGVQVVPHGAGEQHRLLRNDADLAAQLVQPQR